MTRVNLTLPGDPGLSKIELLPRSTIADIVNRAASGEQIKADQIVALADMALGFLWLGGHVYDPRLRVEEIPDAGSEPESGHTPNPVNGDNSGSDGTEPEAARISGEHTPIPDFSLPFLNESVPEPVGRNAAAAAPAASGDTGSCGDPTTAQPMANDHQRRGLGTDHEPVLAGSAINDSSSKGDANATA